MTTNIESLPLLNIAAFVGSDEDLVISLLFMFADGVTPLSLAGITFTATLTSEPAGTVLEILSGSHIVISGAGSNILTITELAAEKTSWGWPAGTYALDIRANDGTYSKDVCAFGSTVTVGLPGELAVSVVAPAGGLPPTVALPAQRASLVQAEIAATLVALPETLPAAGQVWLNGGILAVSRSSAQGPALPYLVLQAFTVATLPAPPSGGFALAYVTDALNPSTGTPLTGGSNVPALAVWNGSAWLAH